MDESVTWIGVALLVIGVIGIFITYSGISRTFEEGLQAVAVLALLLGILILPGGLARGGFPTLRIRQAAVLGTVIAASAAGLSTAALIGYGPFELLYPAPEAAAESPIKANVTIVEGSWDPTQEVNYVPKEIRVIIGINNTVVWTNTEELDISHTVTSEAGIWDSGLFGKGESFKFTFTRPGVYRYFCIPHPWMRGVVVVEELPSEQVERILEQLGVEPEVEVRA